VTANVATLFAHIAARRGLLLAVSVLASLAAAKAGRGFRPIGFFDGP
jgi:hypothetical protein